MFMSVANRADQLSYRTTPGVLRLAALVLTLVLGGCAWLQARMLSPVPADRPHLMVGSSAPLHVVGGQRYTGPSQRQDYLLLRGDAGQAELIYIDATGYNAGIRYHGDRLRRFTADWHVNDDGMHDWGQPRTLDTPLATFEYVLYRVDDRPCAAFQALWDVPPGDARQRPGKLIFGYYCVDAAAGFDASELKQLLDALQPGFPPAVEQAEPIPLVPAAGGRGATGYHDFPRLLPIHQPPIGGDTIRTAAEL